MPTRYPPEDILAKRVDYTGSAGALPTVPGVNLLKIYEFFDAYHSCPRAVVGLLRLATWRTRNGVA